MEQMEYQMEQIGSDREKANILIFPSRRTMTLADCLKAKISTEDSRAEIRTPESLESPDKSISKILEEEGYDFAVMIVARDDVVKKQATPTEQLKARDSYVLEAGILMGVLGRERVFVISSLRLEEVPAHFKGMICGIHEPDRLDDSNACLAAISGVADEILKAMKERGRRSVLKLEIISHENMRLKQRLRGNGGEIEPQSEIFFMGNQPFDVSYEYALQVRRNIKYECKYFYLFCGEEEVARRICTLLQMLLIADFCEDKKKADEPRYRMDITSRKQSEMLIALQEIVEMEALHFGFFPGEMTYRYIMHNASDIYKAKSYLEYGERGFISWVTGRSAEANWRNIKLVFPRKSEGIFVSNALYDFSSDPGRLFRAAIETELKKILPDVDHEKMKQLCFG